MERFVRATGVDLIVPNLGTEHRAATDAPLEYRRDLAREITRRVGPILALHGTSSLGHKISAVAADGICKVNFHTTLARVASTAVRDAWLARPLANRLPLTQACGSFIHRTRRDQIATHVQHMLGVLAT